MISYDEALAIMIDAARPLPNERVFLEEAIGRYVADPVVASIDAPRADVSAMDGYAIRLDDARRGDWLEIVGISAPGAPFSGQLSKGQAVKILTGAAVPVGADCVVIQEEAETDGKRMRPFRAVDASSNTRARGSDFLAGDTLVPVGTRLSPAALVAVAGGDSAGITVARRPQLSLISTGDELVEPGTASGLDHVIPDSGSIGVAAMASQRGALLAGKRRGKDRLGELEELAGQALAESDLVVVIGGASVGERDFAKAMFDRFGLRLHFAKVALKPGKPVWFGEAGGKHVLGLPGNPSSAMVTARIFLVPLLTAMQGGNPRASVAISPQVLAAPLGPSGARETFTRAMMTADGLLPADNQQSGAQGPLAASDWLIRRPGADGAHPAGATVLALPF